MAKAILRWRRSITRALEQQSAIKPTYVPELRSLAEGNGEFDQAKAMYRQGLDLYPSMSIRNYANLLRERR